MTPEDIKKLQTTVADLEAQLQDTVAYQGTIVKTNLFGTETWQGPNGAYQISKKLASERAKEWGTLKSQLEEAKAQLEEALALQALLEKAKSEGITTGKKTAVDAAEVVDPEIRTKAAKIGGQGIARIEKGKQQIAAGTANISRGQRELDSAKEFGF